MKKVVLFVTIIIMLIFASACDEYNEVQSSEINTDVRNYSRNIISAGRSVSTIIKSDNSLWAWGTNA